MSLPALLFFGHVTDAGKLLLTDRAGFVEAVQALRGQSVDVTIRKHRKARSDKQSRYYYGVVVKVIGDALGYTKDEAHEALAWHFLQVGDGDTKLPRRRSTADLSTHEMEDYLSQVKQFAAETLGVYVPDPNEVDL